MFPYHDENETQRTPVITLALIALNIGCWLLVQGGGSTYALAWSICELGLIPGELTGLAEPGSSLPLGDGLACYTGPEHQVEHVFTSMFLHGGWMHLLGNMWFLWLFGNNVEDAMSRGRFVVFYLLCGIAAAAAQVVSSPASIVPMVGASGAISGVMGAYLLLYPRVRIYMVVPLGFIPLTFRLPAWTMLLYWFGMQMLSGLLDLEQGVAIWAHVGGFVAGMLLIKAFTDPRRTELHERRRWAPARRTRRYQARHF